MTLPKSASSDDVIPPGRVVRWLVLAGVILLAIVLYFKFGTLTPHLGTAPTP
jgi:hypothetical protein